MITGLRKPGLHSTSAPPLCDRYDSSSKKRINQVFDTLGPGGAAAAFTRRPAGPIGQPFYGWFVIARFVEAVLNGL